MTLAPGTKLGPYEVQSAVGSGGMGEVYRAQDTRLDRTVAIKVLPAEVAGDPRFRERFEREGRTISRLNHPNICTLHDIGLQDGIAFLVLEFIQGETLATRLERGALPLAQALRIAVEVCDALDKAHALGVVHRDLKPANVMLTKAGTKLLDFGLARETGPARPASSPGEPAPTVAMGLTAEGMILGTVPYMAPEQVEGRGADARSDVWSFGCLLYEMVTGAPPFTGQSPASLMAAILEHEPEPISRRMAAAPPMLERIIATCLRKDPADRWQSARDLLHELGWLASGLSGELAAPAPSRPPRPWQLALAAAGLAVLALAVGWALGRRGAASVPARRAGPPVIVLMDSTHPQRVYDDDTRKAGGTNADDLTDLLRDLPVSLVKETTNVQWHRESQVLQEDPDLIVVHRSCFFDATYFPDPAASEQTYPFAADKFEMFIGLVGTSNPRTRFLVYSRKSWKDAAERDRWVGNLERRFPVLKGRVRAWSVPLDRTSFRHPATGAEIKAQVGELLPKG